MTDYVRSLIRTWVPILVGLIASGLASLGIEVDDQARGILVTVIGGLVGAAYYAIVRAAEKRWPIVGKLLGSASAPVYDISTLPPVESTSKEITDGSA